MPDILIRNIDPEKLERFKARAKRNGRSLQSEAKLLIEEAGGEKTKEEVAAFLKDARQWRKKVGKPSVDSATLIREDRER